MLAIMPRSYSAPRPPYDNSAAFEALRQEEIEPAYYDYMLEQLQVRLDNGPPQESDRRSRRRPEMLRQSGSWTERD